MRNNYLIILFLFVSFISFGQGQDCATPITIPSIPFTGTDNTTNFGNNILGIPGATGCNSTSPTIFSGDEVVYHVNFPQDSPVNISVSNWSSQYGGVFIYEDCADIGVACVAGGTNAANTNTININSFLFTQNQDYYIVITSDAVQGNQTTDYNLNIVCDTPNPPTGNAVQDFCQGDTLADLIVTGTNITWYVNIPAGSANYFPVNPPTAYQLVDQEVYYATQTINGCESGYFLVTANKTPPAPTVSSPQTFCSGDTLADLNIPGTNLIWYSNTSGTNQIPNTTVLVNGTTYYVRDQVGGCLSDVVAVMVEQDPIPPVGDGQQVFCTGETVADLIVGGQNLTWYSDAAGTNVIANPSGVALTNGTTYYVSQTEGSCESDLLPIEAILITPPIGDATQGFCPNMTVSDLEVEGNDLVWYSDAAGTQVITDPSTTTLTNGTTYYVSQTYGPNCESALLAVTVNQLSTSQCNYISVDDTTYTTTQLVQDILIENPCAYTTDIQGITGVNFGNAANGIAYFKNYNPAFPIGSGLLLATGHAEAVEGPLSNVNFFPGGGWPADTQLSTYTNNLLSVTDTYHDATIVEFEFFPLSDQVSFNYVFSSNEYGTYQCGFSDPFAFFLEDPNGNVINMAKVPVTGDIVSVVTIRDQQYNPGCSSENITYFDKFYGASPGAPGLPGSSAPINVKGHTVKMLASATVVPLTNYKMKMVIQNRQDSSFDAAVFIEEGSFFIGFDLGPDLTFANGGVDCDDEDVEIGYTSSSSIATYQWYVYDSNFGEYIPLVGETNPMYTVTETGTYQLGINLGGDCESTDEIYVEIGTPPIVPTSPIEFFDCQQGGGSSGTATFDLTTQHANILNGQQNVSLTWYEDQIDADAGNANSIPTPTAYTNTTPYNQTIYVRMESQEIGNCYEVVPAIIVVGEAPDVPTPIANLEQCDDDTDGVMTFNLEDNEAAIVVNEPNPGDYTVTYHDSAINRTNGVAITTPTAYDNTSPTQTIYVRVENPDGCITDLTFDIIVYPLPTYNVPITYTLCDQGTQDGQTPFDLTISTTQIAGANTNLNITYYETASDADGDLPVNPIASPYTNTTPYNQTIYVRIVDINTGCYVVEPLDLEVVQTPVLTTPPAYELCDGDGDNQASFDLTTLNGQISTDPGLTFTYHATQADADSNSNSTIATPYQSLSTTIYVRAEYAGSGCYETVAVVLTVNPDPDVPATIADLEICDDDTDGTATFDLTDREGDITVNQPTGTTYDVSYYASASDRTNGVPITSETSYPSSSATIYVLVEDTSTSCTTESQFDIVVNPLPDVPAPIPPIEECDDDNDGLMFFDLTENGPIITQNEPNPGDYDVIYYPSATDRTNGTNEITAPTSYQNTTANQQTIYVVVEDVNTGCSTEADFEIIVNAQLPTTAPAPYELCDGDGDGQATFDLTTLNSQISTDPTYSYSYHATQANAQAGTPTIASNYTTGSTTVYVRVESSAVADCYNVVPAQLVVVPDPVIPTIPDLELCDDNTDGQEAFDLTQNEPTIVQNEPAPGDYAVTYYASLNDLNNNNPITTPTAYTNTAPDQQTIYVVVEDSNTGCTGQGQFDIIVNPIPAYNTPVPLIICDDGGGTGMAEFDLTDATTQITGNAPNLNASYFETQLGAENNDPNDEIGPLYTNTTPYNQTIWVRVYDINTGCYAVDSMDLQVNDAPIANTPPPFIYCDDDNDGVGQFILTDLDDDINNDPNVTITYHQTQANADNDVIPLSSPFTNTVNTAQTIYVRVEAPGVSCYTTIAITLQVEDSPQPVLAQDLDPLEACDTNGNGSEVFDLTQMEAAILANDVPPAAATDFTIRYYTDAAHTQEITVPTAYTSNGMNQTIYVVVEGLNGCTGETSFELIVHPMPSYQHPQPLELCDVNNPGDEMEAFTLEDATLDITNGDNTLDVTYYDNQADADAGTNPLSSPYTNTENNQTIYVRVEDTDTGCFVSQGFTLTLVVNPLPSPQVPTDPLEVCDVDNDGFVEFDLAAQIPIIQNGETDVTITFHLTQGAAESGNQAIDTTQPFGISSANNQTIYVRATNDLTGCYVVEPLTLEVVPSPTIENLEDLYECDDETLDGFALFDLTENDDNVLGGQDPNEVTVSYYESQADAEAGQDAIAVPGQYTNIVNPQQIFVRIEHNTTGCYDTFDFAGDNSFWIEVELYPAVVEPTDLALCDDDYNTVPVPQTIFDLTVKEGEMSGQNLPPGNYQFTYYASDADYQAGTPIADPENYQNIANPQTLVVEVVNTDTQGLCATTVNLTINVLPLPSPDSYTPDQLRLYQCDDDNDGVAADPFDLTQSGAMIAGGENVNLSYYTNQSAAEQGDTASASYIATPDQYVNDPSLNVLNADGVPVQIIYVRVESGVAGNDCYVVTSFEIQVVPAPVLNPAGQPFGYTLCEDGNSGTAAVQLDDIAENVYDLTNGDPATLVPLLDPNENDDLDINNYQISYYFTAAAAEAGDSTQEVPNGYNASDGESFFIRIEYLSTGCYNTGAIGEVVITVEQRPAINAVDLNETLCSDEQGGNSVTVDLTQYDGQISTGAPNTAVVYYADMNAYMSGDEVADPTSFTTTDNPQTVIAEVIDTETLCESADFATITFNINTTPIVDISGYDGMIICEDLDPSTPTEGGDYTPITIDTGLSQTQYDFVWTLDGTTLPETGSSIDATQAGTYEVTVTDVFNNCSASSSATIGASNPPEFTATATTLAFAGEHTVVVSNVTGIGDYEFSIDNGPWTDLGSNTSLTFEGLGGGTHTIRGRDKNGCGTTIVTITIVDYPAFFTPNNDGYNDTWNIYGLAESDPSAKIYIFDRYGKLLKQISPMGEGWDGTYNGTQMPSGDYWFKVEYQELDMNTGQAVRKELMDNITLKR